MEEIKLGLCQIPRPIFLFVENTGSSGWYTLQDDKKVSVESECLVGTITKIDINKSVNTTMGAAFKTDLHMACDRNYVIRSGSATYFNKSLLFALNTLSPEQLRSPIAIAAKPGEKTVVFCEVYTLPDWQKVKFSWDGHENIDMRSLEKEVAAKINGGYQSRT